MAFALLSLYFTLTLFGCSPIKAVAWVLSGMRPHGFYPSTGNKRAHGFFNRAIALTYGFNHLDAQRSYRQVAALDPNNALAYWGQALVLGPNINGAIEPSAVRPSYEAITKALMVMHSWDHGNKDGRPKEWINEILRVLEGGLNISPSHVGLNHYYIHAVEASKQPERALARAKALENGWSLYGLHQSHLTQGLSTEATKVNERFFNGLAACRC